MLHKDTQTAWQLEHSDRHTSAALAEEALPWRARAPTPAKMAASLKMPRAMKKAHSWGEGSWMPRTWQYSCTYSASLGTPAPASNMLWSRHSHVCAIWWQGSASVNMWLAMA